MTTVQCWTGLSKITQNALLHFWTGSYGAVQKSGEKKSEKARNRKNRQIWEIDKSEHRKKKKTNIVKIEQSKNRKNEKTKNEDNKDNKNELPFMILAIVPEPPLSLRQAPPAAERVVELLPPARPPQLPGQPLELRKTPPHAQGNGAKPHLPVVTHHTSDRSDDQITISWSTSFAEYRHPLIYMHDPRT